MQRTLIEGKLIDNDEAKKIIDIGLDDFTGRCSCGIQDNKPSHCKKAPFPINLTPFCGFSFFVENNKTYRIGECLRCGRCCATPRKNGDPYGVYDPTGSKCRHLIVKER